MPIARKLQTGVMVTPRKKKWSKIIIPMSTPPGIAISLTKRELDFGEESNMSTTPLIWLKFFLLQPGFTGISTFQRFSELSGLLARKALIFSTVIALMRSIASMLLNAT